MKGKGPLSRMSRFCIILLALSVVVNSTQAVVLCMETDGHVAIELAGHYHCHSEHESREAPHESSDGADEHKTPCLSCVDIALSPGISDEPVLQKTPAINALSAGTALSVSDIGDQNLETFAAAGTYPAFTPFYDPLICIILII